jgi:hypothetical protein
VAIRTLQSSHITANFDQKLDIHKEPAIIWTYTT